MVVIIGVEVLVALVVVEVVITVVVVVVIVKVVQIVVEVEVEVAVEDVLVAVKALLLVRDRVVEAPPLTSASVRCASCRSLVHSRRVESPQAEIPLSQSRGRPLAKT